MSTMKIDLINKYIFNLLQSIFEVQLCGRFITVHICEEGEISSLRYYKVTLKGQDYNDDLKF